MFSLGHASLLHANAAVLYLLLYMSIQTSCLHFDYAQFQQSDNPYFILEPNINNGALQISPPGTNAPPQNTSGRVLYKDSFKLHCKGSSVLASFSTTFMLNILPQTRPGGEGAAFILTNNLAVPSNSYGQWLGLVNEQTNGSSKNRLVAIEFDIRKSYIDDLDDNHVGVDVNSINSIAQSPLGELGVHLSSGRDVIANVRYEGGAGIMTVDVAMADAAPPNITNPAIKQQIDLSKYLLEDVYVGFSASTGDHTQLSYIKSWNFTSSELGRRHPVWLLPVLPVIAGALFLSLVILGYVSLRMKKANQRKTNLELGSVLEDSTTGPQGFRLKDIKSATKNFNPRNKLGQGGFGTVYKGYLKMMKMEVAVKRVAKNSRQGMQEFVAEVTTISKLRHKNLVKLLGWCYEGEELLLVYEFMPKGSLDKLIFSNGNPSSVALCWEKRYKAICGVANALSYLHEGCEMRVLHRDVKASNVMIDSNYNARLGDFGLARTVQCNSQTRHYTTAVAGTPGFIAPECSLTGRASAEGDVYGFGVFTIEVTCGRRPGSYHRDHGFDVDESTSIVDWLWDLYGEQRLFDAVDPRLLGAFDAEQMGRVLRLGLACCHPNPNERPSMRVALQVLNGEAAPPIPPNEKPTFMWPVINTCSEVFSFHMEGSLHSDGGGNLSPCTDLSGR